MTDKDTLRAIFTAAKHAYDEAFAEERAAAREYVADLKAVAEAGEERRKATARERSNTYKAYILARTNLDAWRGE